MYGKSEVGMIGWNRGKVLWSCWRYPYTVRTGSCGSWREKYLYGGIVSFGR